MHCASMPAQLRNLQVYRSQARASELPLHFGGQTDPGWDQQEDALFQDNNGELSQAQED